MLNVMFENSKGQKRIIGAVENEELAFKVINDFLDDHNYKSYYQRTWKKDDKTTVVDVGSHTEFFYIQEVWKMKKFKENIAEGGIVALISIAILIGLGAISWLITCGIFYLITLCFSLEFSWLTATGVWLVMILLRSIFSVTVKNKE